MLREHVASSSARALLLALAAILALAGTVQARAAKETVAINYHAQAAMSGLSGPVGPSATATLVRRPNGVSYHFQTTNVRPGHAYTLWFVAINNWSACATPVCTGGEIVLQNAITDSQVTFGGGHVAGGSGRLTIAGSFKEGEIEGWFAGRGLNDALDAHIHLVLNDHGPKLPGYMPGMIHTYRGGCTDASLPGVFHQGAPAAIADGTPGPNACQLFQTAVFN